MPTEVLHAPDHGRHGTRALRRLEITDHALVVVVHELGPPRGPDDGEARTARWSAWVEQLQPPAVSDDLGGVYTLERRAERAAIPAACSGGPRCGWRTSAGAPPRGTWRWRR